MVKSYSCVIKAYGAYPFSFKVFNAVASKHFENYHWGINALCCARDEFCIDVWATVSVMLEPLENKYDDFLHEDLGAMGVSGIELEDRSFLSKGGASLRRIIYKAAYDVRRSWQYEGKVVPDEWVNFAIHSSATFAVEWLKASWLRDCVSPYKGRDHELSGYTGMGMQAVFEYFEAAVKNLEFTHYSAPTPEEWKAAYSKVSMK